MSEALRPPRRGGRSRRAGSPAPRSGGRGSQGIQGTARRPTGHRRRATQAAASRRSWHTASRGHAAVDRRTRRRVPAPTTRAARTAAPPAPRLLPATPCVPPRRHPRAKARTAGAPRRTRNPARALLHGRRARSSRPRAPARGPIPADSSYRSRPVPPPQLAGRPHDASDRPRAEDAPARGLARSTPPAPRSARSNFMVARLRIRSVCGQDKSSAGTPACVQRTGHQASGSRGR